MAAAGNGSRHFYLWDATLERNIGMIKRFNKFIISRLWGIRLRPTGAVFLGAFAGLSLTATILPEALTAAGLTDSFSARIDLAGFAVYSIMLWAVGGWSAQRTGNPWLGGVALGLVGGISGAIFTGLAYGARPLLLLLGGGAGLAYGAVGGILIATALAEHKTTASTHPTH